MGKSKQKIISLLNPVFTFGNIYRSRDLLLQILRRNIHIRYKGTIFGLFWVVATPLFMLAVYTFVFSVVFNARWGTDVEASKVSFALILFCGLTVFNIFSESITGAVGVISGNPNYVSKVVFPLEILPIVSVLTAFFLGLIWFFILLAGIGLFLHEIYFSIICIPLLLLPLFFFSCGLAWFVASLGVYFRDLGHAIGIILQMMFFMTPIFYSAKMVPEPLRSILQFNPLTVIIQSVRKVLIYGQWPEWGKLAILTCASLVLFELGYAWFMKTKRGFADVL